MASGDTKATLNGNATARKVPVGKDWRTFHPNEMEPVFPTKINGEYVGARFILGFDHAAYKGPDGSVYLQKVEDLSKGHASKKHGTSSRSSSRSKAHGKSERGTITRADLQRRHR